MIKTGKPQEDPAVFLLYHNMKWGSTVKYTTVIFDLDGTLLNTLEDLQGSVNRAMLLHGFPERSLEEVRQFVGNGIRRLLERCVPDGSQNPAFEQALEDFKTDYGIHCNDKTRPYPGILSMLEAFKAQGMKMAIVSNKADFAVKKLCSIYFDGLIPAAVGQSEELRKKPAPDMVEQALKELGAEKETAVYVGDSEVDLLTAKNSGLFCISADWGFRSREFLKAQGAETFVSSAEELEKMLLS